jgi:hypothetical protein
MCSCHHDGPQNICYFFDCCNCGLCNQKYIDKNGNLDIIRFNELSKTLIKKEPPYIDGGEYVVKNKNNYNTTYVKESRK